jgi:anti-sigma-K factor RskA
MPDPNHVMDELPALALGLLDETATARVSAHLAHCAHCREEWLSYRETVGLLSAAISPAQPPERVKRSMLNAIAQVKTAQPSRENWASKFRHLLAHPTPLGSLAGMAIIVLLVINNLVLWQRSTLPLSPARAGYGTVPLLANDPSSDASGMVVYTLDGDSGFLVVNHLHHLPSGQAYQLWLIEDGKRTSGGVFSVDENGYWVMQVKSPQLLTGYDSFGITIEPAGGSPGPTGPKVLGGSF